MRTSNYTFLYHKNYLYSKPVKGLRGYEVGYGFSFNGKEKDDEVSGKDNHIDYGDRVYDPRIIRFLSVDPLTKVFPMLSCYQYASNSPIANIDLDGREAESFIFGLKKKIFGVTSLQMNNVNSVVGEIQEQFYRIGISNPQKSVKELYAQIVNDINSIYGTNQGSFAFEKQQYFGQITKGDYINIDPNLKGLDMFVKVVDVSKINNDYVGVDLPHTGFSMTFRTLEGHVEVGCITFTALEITMPKTGIKYLEFSVSSTSQIDVGIATTPLLNNYARNAQQSVWHQVLKNVSNFCGGTISTAKQSIDKYKISEFNAIDNKEKTIGESKQEATPERQCSDINTCD